VFIVYFTTQHSRHTTNDTEHTDRQTERQTERQTDTQTERKKEFCYNKITTLSIDFTQNMM